ncbi:3-dehydroshikimate dehydratase [Trichoderma arundinaceum]|uniref:3-dehydroshikimate dehydratase n=1 Tax=Trichoderma arundinaceum TaxID=490622 RepID=A0A395NVU4_TRIAR|nr:3-dehydroshikimate dehydratase [Trichoderma arundinaceum]
MVFLPGIASPSLGHQTAHSIESRLKAAASHGFKLIELVEDDLAFYAKDKLGGAMDSSSSMIQAAHEIKGICDKLGIRPIVLQPFWFYDGLTDRKQHEAAIEKLRLWMKLVKVLNVQIVQLPSNWLLEGTTGDLDSIVADLIEMAEIGLEQDPVVSFAYEAVAWGTHVATWQGSWELVKRVNKPNFGLCLDTYHIVARDWGDPTVPGCKRPDGDENFQRSMKELVEHIDIRKVFYVQVSDAELLSKPLVQGHPYFNEQQLPRMAWSRNARLFPWEEDQNGCLPIELLVDTIFKDLKYTGYVTVESFSRHLLDKNPGVPNVFAARAMKSWAALMKRIE